MNFSNNILSRLNIQIFIIFINIEYMIDSMYSIADGAFFDQTDKIMLISSTLNLLISLVLYGMYLKNRMDIDHIMVS
ncbi:hypothetical protein [Tepidibacter mesophilus]|uniref:hypothetical protein n=1 Tax=Tepidibacter mesophilus TaxID=655607 RepID=UPI000C06F470|nr:hypothetical protein [Tepidibacter mesophilus]